LLSADFLLLSRMRDDSLGAVDATVMASRYSRSTADVVRQLSGH